jgi:hypothetical protein
VTARVVSNGVLHFVQLEVPPGFTDPHCGQSINR